MTRQLRITHHTGYSYEGMVSASHNEVRMTPRSSREQFVVSSRIDIVPKPWLLGYQDYWRTWVTAFEIREPHQRLDVTATSVVDVSRGLADVPGLTWDQLRDPRLADKHFEMLQVSDHVDPGRVLRTFAAEAAREAERPAQAVAAVIGRIREHVSYVPGSTHVRTRAADAWEAGAGVCQDMVHLALGALRGMGVPARYVSGYVMPCANPVVGQPRTGESHAWLQYWDGAWVGLDPTNDTAPGELHVEVGVGRDYSDVPPLRGVFSGSGESELYVEVEMTVLG